MTKNLEFEIGLCVYREMVGGVDGLTRDNLVKLTEEKHKFLSETERHYMHKNNFEAVFSDERFDISDYSIKYDDVRDICLLKYPSDIMSLDSGLPTASRYYDDYPSAHCLRIAVAESQCSLCQDFSGLSESVKDHLKTSHEHEKSGSEDEDSVPTGNFYYFYMFYGSQSSDENVKIADTPSGRVKDLKKAKEVLRNRCNNCHDKFYVLKDWISLGHGMKIHGPEDGRSFVSGGLSGTTESSGKSRGVQIGPFTRGKSESSGSIEADLGATISEQSPSSSLDFFRVSDDHVYVESDPVLNVPHSRLTTVRKAKERMGYERIHLGIDNSVFTCEVSQYIDEADSVVSFLTNKITEMAAQKSTDTQSSGQTTAEKIRDLGELYESGIITEEEFQMKKQELLDEF
jgi:hypothetical protein